METNKYFIMRKNEIITLALFSNDGALVSYSKNIEGRADEIAPLAYRIRPNDWLNKWWKERAIPLTRDQIGAFLSEAGYNGPEEYLIKNLGLSLTDYYWIKPVDTDLTWEKVNLYNNHFHDDILLREGVDEEGDIPKYSPNSSLQGNIEKAWTIINGERCLIKGNHSRLSTESLNELLATEIHRTQGYDNYTPYQLIRITGKAYDYGCVSKAFTSQELELVPAWAVCTTEPKDNNTSYYEHFIRLSKKHGIDDELLRRDLEYQILTDFIISGYDRHLNNVSILRDAETLKFGRMAPIYDSGGAMFVDRPFPKSIRELERMNVTSFAPRENKLLKLVKDPSVVDVTKLPSPEFVKNLYAMDSQISESTIKSMVEWYEKKAEMTRGLQLGIDPFGRRIIQIPGQSSTPKRPEEFVLISGIPGSGKTEIANNIAKQMKDDGWREVPSSALLSIREADQYLFPYTDPERMKEYAVNKELPFAMDKCFVRVSPEAVRKELNDDKIYADNKTVFSLVDSRMECALKNGWAVVYEATNIDNEIRNRYLQIAEKYNVVSKTMIISEGNVKQAIRNRPDIPRETIVDMAKRLGVANKNISKSWTSVKNLGGDVNRQKNFEPDR